MPNEALQFFPAFNSSGVLVLLISFAVTSLLSSCLIFLFHYFAKRGKGDFRLFAFSLFRLNYEISLRLLLKLLKINVRKI